MSRYVERLRLAAQTLRTLAQNATPPPWSPDGPFWVDPPGSTDGLSVETRSGVSGAGQARELVAEGTWESKDATMLYIAFMDPELGEAVAGWLENLARRAEAFPSTMYDSKAATVADIILRKAGQG